MRKHKAYRIRIPNLKHPQQVPGSFYHRFIALGWLVSTASRMAMVRKGVTAWLEDGKLRLQDNEAGVSISIPTSWRAIERAALYSDKGPRVGTREYEQAIQRWHCER